MRCALALRPVQVAMLFLLLCAPAAAAALAVPASLSLSAAQITSGHVWEGHGALSAGASSRLLWDYSEPERSQILDYLFKPNFGAGLSILKVEIGGDGASTDGTEPSHEHARGDLSCTRGYELWLAKEARARNPAIKLYGLSWAVPAWVGNGSFYSADNVDYQTQWVSCMRAQLPAAANRVDFLGLWNEKPQPPSADYVLALRAALDASGASATKLIVMDGGFDSAEVALAAANASYKDAIYGAGLHYPCDNPQPSVREVGWTFWASEDYSRDPAWDDGTTYWAKALSQNYVLMNMTATISWSLIWSAYTNFVCNGAGLMRAHQPWSGNYEASGPIWVTAHWTQFAAPGWRFLGVAGGGSGFLLDGSGARAGTFISLVPPEGSPPALTLILETAVNSGCLARAAAAFDVRVSVAAGGALPGAGTPLQVWQTTADAFFVRLADTAIAADGSFSVHVPADAIVTVSSAGAGATHGGFPGSPIPEAAPFPLPYYENFTGYAEDAMARYLSDQGGSWAVRGGALVQTSPENPGANAWAPSPDPFTILGDESWRDYQVAATVVFADAPPPAAAAAAPAPAALPPRGSTRAPRARAPSARETAWRAGRGLPPPRAPRLLDVPTIMAPCDAADRAQAWTFDAPDPGYLSNRVGAAQLLCLNVGGCVDDSIIFYQCVDDPAGSSCGAPPGQYPNLRWALNASSGALITAMDGGALTLVAPSNGSLAIAPFTGAPAQRWAHDAASGALSLPAYGLCLSTPPARVYAQVCARIQTYNGFDAVEAIPGYCLQLDKRGDWQLLGGGALLASGSAGAGFAPTSPHRLAVDCEGPLITASLDGVALAAITSGNFTYGNAGLGSGYHTAAFTQLALSPPA